jgi:hypothetical protein
MFISKAEKLAIENQLVSLDEKVYYLQIAISKINKEILLGKINDHQEAQKLPKGRAWSPEQRTKMSETMKKRHALINDVVKGQ